MTSSRVAGPFSPGTRSVTAGTVALVALFALEYVAVSAAMPTVADDLDGYSLYNLAFGATVAASVVGMVLGGWGCDRLGPRPVVLGSAGAFLLGLLVAGLSTSFDVFCVGRAIQGLGTGMANVAVYVVIAQLVPDEVRPRVFSLLAAAWVLPGLVGPLLTGFVVAHFTWHWVFLGVVPFVVVAVAVIEPALRRTTRAAEGTFLSRATLLWTTVAAVAVGLLNVSGESVAGAEWIIGAVLLVLLVVASRHLLPAGTLRVVRGLPAVMGVRGALGGSFIAAEAYLPLLLRDEHGYSPARSGAVLAVASVTWAVGSALQGRLRPGADRARVMTVGVTLYAALMVVLALAVYLGWSGAVVVALYGAAIFGVGLAYPVTTLLTMRLSPEAEIGRNSSALQLSEALASAFTLAVTGVVFGLTYGRGGTTAFVLTLAAAVVVGVIAVLCALRARAPQP